MAQVRELSRKVATLELEMKNATENTKKLVWAVQEKTITLEKKEKEWEERGKEVAKLEAEVARLQIGKWIKGPSQSWW